MPPARGGAAVHAEALSVLVLVTEGSMAATVGLGPGASGAHCHLSVSRGRDSGWSWCQKWAGPGRGLACTCRCYFRAKPASTGPEWLCGTEPGGGHCGPGSMHVVCASEAVQGGGRGVCCCTPEPVSRAWPTADVFLGDPLSERLEDCGGPLSRSHRPAPKRAALRGCSVWG